ncbi:MAG: ATP-binding protein [Burkholderiaceae bacterium]|nr:MAG: ATP-binding protein [Burkholderiaceae bacterium]
MTTKLIFFCGHAGSGKTTTAKRVLKLLRARQSDSFAFLDKDTLYGEYSCAVMGLLTGDPNDRDSPTYLNHLRQPEYDGLLHTAREQLEFGTHTFVIGPLSRELKSRDLFDRTYLKIDSDVDIRVVWVHISEELAHQRIAQRADHRDAYKLKHWEDYRTRRFFPDPVEYPELIYFDNTAPSNEDFTQLATTLMA